MSMGGSLVSAVRPASSELSDERIHEKKKDGLYYVEKVSWAFMKRHT